MRADAAHRGLAGQRLLPKRRPMRRVVLLARQQGIDQFGPLARRFVRHEFAACLGGRDHADDIQIHAPDEGCVVANRRRVLRLGQFGLRPPGLDKWVDLIERRPRDFGRRRGGRHQAQAQRAARGELLVFVVAENQNILPMPRRVRGQGRNGVGPHRVCAGQGGGPAGIIHRARRDPGADQVQFILRQRRFALGHLRSVGQPANILDDRTLIRFARHDARSALFPALHQSGRGRNVEPAFKVVVRVAFIAVGGKERFDIARVTDLGRLLQVHGPDGYLDLFGIRRRGAKASPRDGGKSHPPPRAPQTLKSPHYQRFFAKPCRSVFLRLGWPRNNITSLCRALNRQCCARIKLAFFGFKSRSILRFWFDWV